MAAYKIRQKGGSTLFKWVHKTDMTHYKCAYDKCHSSGVMSCHENDMSALDRPTQMLSKVLNDRFCRIYECPPLFYSSRGELKLSYKCKTLSKMPSIFCVHVCDQPQKQRADAARLPDPPCECSCDPKWPRARPLWCLRLKVLLLIHREEPLALPAAELIVGHSVHSFPLRKQLPAGPATNGLQARNA